MSASDRLRNLALPEKAGPFPPRDFGELMVRVAGNEKVVSFGRAGAPCRIELFLNCHVAVTRGRQIS